MNERETSQKAILTRTHSERISQARPIGLRHPTKEDHRLQDILQNDPRYPHTLSESHPARPDT